MESVKYKLYILSNIQHTWNCNRKSFCYFQGLICSTVRENRGFLDQATNLTSIPVAFTRVPFLCGTGNELGPLHKKMKFSIKDYFSKCDQIRRKLWIWSHLLKKSLMENFIFCAVVVFQASVILEAES